MNAVRCPLCAAPGLRPFIEFPRVPASGILTRAADEAVPVRDLAFDYCPVCACVVQRPGMAAAVDYRAVARPTARQLPAYAHGLIGRLKQGHDDGLVVEVGCNDGAFLTELRSAGFMRRLGVEPSQSLAASARAAGHEVAELPLNEAAAGAIVARHGAARRVVCRHTLEHVPEPLDFLRALRTLLAADGLACIEVPSLAPIIERLHVQELWDEHLTYFLPDNLVAAFTAAGFAVDDITIEPHRGMENIVVWVRRVEDAPRNNSFAADEATVTMCTNFAFGWQATAERLRSALSRLPSPRVVLGASHPQANFINFAELAPLVDTAIDDDPAKAGRWLPLIGQAVPIYPSAELARRVAGGTLILAAFGYPEWMARVRLSVAGNNTQVLDVTCVHGVAVDDNHSDSR